MKFFALETDQNKIVKKFCHDEKGEQLVYVTYYHSLSFLFAVLDEIAVTIGLFAVGIVCWYFGLPMIWVTAILALLWFLFVIFNVTKAYIDWLYDFVFITTDKIVLVDQTAIFRQQIKPIHIENVGSISTDTQFWNIFPFGIVNIHLKEGAGGEKITLKYVPRSEEFAAKISDVLTYYQRHIDAGQVTSMPQTSI